MNCVSCAKATIGSGIQKLWHMRIGKVMMYEVKGEFIKNKNKRSTVRIVPDTLEYLKEIKHSRRMKIEIEESHLP